MTVSCRAIIATLHRVPLCVNRVTHPATQHVTAINSTWRPRQDGRDGRERLCRTSFKLHMPLVLKVTTQHPQYFPLEAEMRRPSQDQRKADSLEWLRQAQGQSRGSLLFCFCLPIKSFHFHKNFPHCALISSVTTIRDVPIHAILLLPLCHFWRSQGFPPTSNVGISAIGLSLVTFFGIEKNIVVQACCCHFATLLHLHWKLHDFSSCFSCQIQGNFRVESVASHTISMPFSRSPSFNLGNAFTFL